MKLLATAAFALGSFSVSTALAFLAPQKAPAGNFDKRHHTYSASPSVAQAEALALLSTRVPHVQVSFDAVLGSPRWVRATDQFLTGPNGAGLGVSAQVAGLFAEDDSNRAAKGFMYEFAGLFGHGPQQLDGAVLRRDFITPHSGLRTRVWQQQVESIPVFQGLFITHVTAQGELVSISSSFIPNPGYAATLGTPNYASVIAAPPISATEALARAARDLGEVLRLDDIQLTDLDPADGEKPRLATAPQLRGQARLRLTWLPVDRSTMRLCWKVELSTRWRSELYRLLVDAQSGKVWLRHSLTHYLTDATYRVYVSDSPSPFSPGHATPSSEQPPPAERQLLTLSALNTNASPAGWIFDDGNETIGNNVDAHLDRNDDDAPDLPRPQGSPARVFDFPLALTNAPTSYSKASVVQLFYWNNWMHDRLYELGFTEAAGNFQQDNFDRGGLGNDAVEADAQDGGGFNNANFSTPDDGLPGRMQMYLFDGPAPDRDGSLDAEVILHEYAHGLSNRRLGGGAGITQLQTAGMGEGWSDFYALALLSEPGDDLNGNYAAGGYLTYQLEKLTQNYYFGIRRYPYSVDLQRNPLTFRDIDPGQANSHPGVPVSPIFGGLAPADEVHNQGEVWCVALWEARANLIRKHGFAQGNKLALQLVTDGLNLAPANANFIEARDAIIQADKILSGGENRMELWTAFARRGMGFVASAPPSFTTIGVQEAYDLPDELLVEPRDGFIPNGPEGGPFVPADKTFTLSNVGTNVVNWTAFVQAPWLTLSRTSGAIAAGGDSETITLRLATVASSLPPGVYRDVLQLTNHTTGRTQTRAVTLRVSQPDFLTQLFQANDPLPVNRQFTFTPDGSAGFYSVCSEPATAFPVDTSDSIILSLDDDEFTPLPLANGKPVRFFGNEYATLYLSANGFITFRFGVSEFFESLPAHFSDPRLSAFFHDLDPSAGGTVSWNELDDRAVVSFENVPEFFLPNSHSFQIELFFDGRIRITYLELEAAQALIGLSAGGGIPPDFFQSDFSLYGECLPPLTLEVPAAVNEDIGTFEGIIRIPGTLASDMTVQLRSFNPALVTVPESVLIRSGETTASFRGAVADTGALDGTRVVRIAASGAGFADASVRMRVYDNETGALTVEVIDTAREGDGTRTGAASVRLASASDEALIILLSSSDTNEVRVPNIVILPAGQASVPFDLFIGDDRKIDGPVTTTITAHVENWPDATATLSVTDNETRDLQLSMRKQAGERSGQLAAAGTVRISGTLTEDLNVMLDSNDSSELAVAPQVTIPAGSTEAAFGAEVIDDSEIDGAQVVTVKARAIGFIDGQAMISILDDETPAEPAGPSPADKSINNPARVILTWAIGEGETIGNGGFEAGDFSEWTKENSGGGDFVVTDGTFDPDGPEGAGQPFAGRYSIVSHQRGPGIHIVWQEITIPAGVSSAVLSWADRIRNHAGLYAAGAQEFRVEIQDASGNRIGTAFSTKPGDELLNEWVEREFDASDFIGQTIRIAFIEQDNFGFMNVHLDNISVRLGDPNAAPTVYDVYFGTSSALTQADFRVTTETNRWEPPPLQLDTAYFWQIVARRGVAESFGPVWRFYVPPAGPVDRFVIEPVPSPQWLNEPFTTTIAARDTLDNTATNFNGTVSLSGAVEFPEVSIGDDAMAWGYPMGTFSHDSRTQVIYLRKELGVARRLTALALFVTTVPGQAMTRWTIRIKHTNLERYGSSPLWERTGWTTVYQKNETIDATGWIRFEFATPFDYNGTSNLLIDFSFNNSSFSSDGLCNSSFTSAPRSLAFSADSTFGDPLNWTGQSPFGFADFRIPDVRLYSFTPVPISPSVSGTFTNGVWSGTVEVQQLADGMSLAAKDADEHTGIGNRFDVVARDDLSLAAVDLPDPITVNDSLTYAFNVRNSGPAPATSIILTNELPSTVVVLTNSASKGMWTFGEGVAVWAIGTLEGGAAASMTLTVRPTAVGVITNHATLYRGEPDAVDSNNSVAIATTVTARPSITIADAFGFEGDDGTNVMRFEVTLSVPSSQIVTCEYATAAGTASIGADFAATNGIVTFPPGSTAQTIQVEFFGDTLDEVDETFTVRLSGPTNAAFADSVGLGTIFDDDGPELTIADISVLEGNSGTTNAVFQAVLSFPSKQTVTIDYATEDGTATAPGDYTSRESTLSIPAGATNRMISIPVRGDVVVEPTETFFLSMLDVQGATHNFDRAKCSILNDDGLAGQLNQFVWSLTPPYVVNQPLAVTLAAADVGGNRVRDFAGTVNLSARAQSPDTQIGNGTTQWEYPMGTLFEDTRIQTIYLTNEIGPARLLTALALNVTTRPAMTLTRWTIRMKHTELAVYGASPAWERTGWTNVYQKNEIVAATGWVFFEFTTPFAYNGTNHLLIDLSFNNADFSFESQGECRFTAFPQRRSIYYQTDSEFGDPLNWAGVSNPVPDVGGEVPNLLLSSNPTIPVTPSASGSFIDGIWNGVINVGASARNVVVTAKTAAGYAGTSAPIDILADTDADGIADEWEELYGLASRDAADAALDLDGDRMTNLAEFLAGTSPRDGGSALEVRNVQIVGSDVIIAFGTVANRRYRIERANEPGMTEWTSIGADVTGSGADAEVTDAGGAAPERQFYRIRLITP